MGMAIDIPSGMLCRAMDMASERPNLVFLVVVIKVMIPSGMLCNMRVMHDINPTLNRVVIFLFLEIFLSM